jgi:hypothetical protein
MATSVPPDGRWILEGIRKKVEDYGGSQHVEGLTLVVGGFGVVDREQIHTFQRDNPPAELPLREIWLVSRLGASIT